MTRLFLTLITTLMCLTPFPAGLGRAAAQDAGDTTLNGDLDLGFEAGKAGETPPLWSVPTAGWAAVLTDTRAAEGKMSLMLVKREDSDAPFGNVMLGVDAAPYRGCHVRLSARIHAEGEQPGQAMMWLRADLDDGTMGAFDNMHDRPIRTDAPGTDTWSDAVIELDIERNARYLSFGFLSIGGATVFVDSARLQVADDPANRAPPQAPTDPRPLSGRGLKNLEAAARLLADIHFFHASDQAVAVMAWDHLAVRLMEEAEPATDAADLARRLGDFFAPIAPTLEVWAGGPDAAPPLPKAPEGADRLTYWRHDGIGNLSGSISQNVYSSTVEHDRKRATLPWGAREFDAQTLASASIVRPLGGGVTCRIPVKVFADDGGTLPHTPVETEWTSRRDKPILTPDNRSTRLAGIATCWGVMQNFYPYFDVVDTDWDAALAAGLSAAAEDSGRLAYLHTLQELISKLHDGHGHVFNRAIQPQSMLPLGFTWAGDDLVVIGTDPSVGDHVIVGDTVLKIEGRSVASWCDEVSTRISAATDGWRRHRLLGALATEIPGSEPVRLHLRHINGAEFDATLDRIAPTQIVDATDRRPADGTELAPGIVYFNMDGADADAFNAAMPALQAAKGIVFDMRGYPGEAGVDLMSHLSHDVVQSARWNIPIVTMPDREGWEWNESGRWQLQPAEPFLDARIAFLTDGRAISYAESIMGIVEAYKMGEIVGSTTAGTNGNVNPFDLPGGYTVYWTGMKVLKHDGSQHHGVGIAPTVPVEPTAAGIAAGRDEVLDKAVEVLQAKLASGVNE
ncbi:MAG: hypothetical protein IPJ41_06825 [Phycisphaerales bacterium]|nr:hypothetical protein [Phycisphaerales bacterium]